MNYLKPDKKKYILNSLPNIEIYNEQRIHNRVIDGKYSYYRIIPKGKKGILVFTQDKNNYHSYFIEIYNNKCTNVIEFNTCFKSTLANGKMATILYGSLNNYNNQNTFTIEDILYYKTRNIIGSCWIDKYNIMNELFNHYIKPEIIIKGQLLILISYTNITSNIDTHSIIQEFAGGYYYPIYTIQYFNGNENYVYSQLYKSTNIVRGTFKITPHIQNDIYEGYDINNNSIGILCVPDYKTSVMLNSYFRMIKENINLDTLEESDDESDFENTDLDKHVYLEKIGIYECVYSTNFEMWIPIKFINDDNFSSIDNVDIIMNKLIMNKNRETVERNCKNKNTQNDKYNNKNTQNNRYNNKYNKYNVDITNKIYKTHKQTFNYEKT